MNAETGKCKCGCGGNPLWGEYLPGHDAKHRSNLVDKAGGVDKLDNLLSYSGPAKLDWILMDDASQQQIDRISASGIPPHANDVLPSIGNCPRWLVTRVGELTVEDWKRIPPVLYFPIYGHKI